MDTQISDSVCEVPVLVSCPGSVELPKWTALVDDQLVEMPQQEVLAHLIKSQAGVAGDRVLVRDHNSPDDVVIEDGEVIDLGSGNVFYTLSRCDIVPRGDCASPAKLAFSVDDRFEITTRPEQSGQSLRDLFSLPANKSLIRDYMGKADRAIAVDEAVRFEDGPVFYTREIICKLQITVNARIFTEADGVKKSMTGKEIAALVYPDKPEETKVWFVSDGNREVGLGEVVAIHGCEVFDVVRKNVDGGYEAARIEKELELLRTGGQAVTLVEGNPAAVIYRKLRAKPGGPVGTSDVLVPVPDAYPGQMLDWAYLPEGSPLIGRVQGQPEAHRITADGVTWQRISYHPHTNGGGPPWNAVRHGFHTYLGELLTWLYGLK